MGNCGSKDDDESLSDDTDSDATSSDSDGEPKVKQKAKVDKEAEKKAAESAKPKQVARPTSSVQKKPTWDGIEQRLETAGMVPDMSQLILKDKPDRDCTTGKLYRGTYVGTEIMQKRLDPKFTNSTCLKREFDQMLRLNHPNILSMLALSLDPPFMVSPFMRRGALADILYGFDRVELAWATKKNFILDITKGLTAIHSSDTCKYHGALNSFHILVAQDWTLTLAGFGANQRLHFFTPREEKDGEPVIIRSLAWSPPELLKAGGALGPATDMYALGIIMWEIVMQDPPYKDINTKYLKQDVLEDQLRPEIPAKLPDGVPQEITSIITDCWAQVPERRPKIEDIKARVQALPD
ncbi:putative Receptor-type guanylate cyclase Gyc76C [Blattamonas nauphoetae]|uniref:Receptor-type guanylate cyclase Gyc76C n=1 Tax=Blattamonas nauphoetae TaxID=2049346 RepID=A0ABQ9YML5_9EUKA|nr:putative Receptor-type guanylate cyclase Gyc76C [Blattamonas nauphoetae]